MNPLVTIAIPTCNRPQYLGEAVRSALAQNYDNIEILIGDDSTTDETREHIEAFASSNRRLSYRRNAQRLGMAANFNALIAKARGEFISIVSDDDRLLPDFVGRLVQAIQPKAHVAFSNHYLIDCGGQRLAQESLEHTRRYHRDKLPAGEIKNVERTVWLNSVPISAALMRTEDVRRLKFREELNTPELELFARLASEGARFMFVPEYLTEYRTHLASATGNGLMSEKLATRLLEITVRNEAEVYKRRFMAPLLVDAVGRCLRQGDIDRARQFRRSKYFPGTLPTRNLRLALHAGVQTVCAALPAPIGCSAYRLARQFKSGITL